MTTIEGKRYVASDADIRQLATDSLQARSSLDKTRSTYLRVLIGSTQADVREEKASIEDQLRIARRKHRHFFQIVLETVMTKDIKPSDRVHERQRRTGFARSASSTLNSWLKVPGHDLMKLTPETVTKSLLAKAAAPRNPHAPTEERTRMKSAKYVEGLLASVKPFAAVDSATAREILQDVVNHLTAELRKLPPSGKSVSVLTQTRIERGSKRALSKKAA